MIPQITTIAFDADDTLWHNERYFRLTQERFTELLAPFCESDSLDARLLAAERRNIGHYGYGIKGFMLSMIETAIEVSEQRVGAQVIREILDIGKEMLRHPIDLLPHAAKAVEAARADHTVLLITKGDLLDQERKLAQSGLGEHFDRIEIVSEKTTPVYARIFAEHGDGIGRALMVGNSMKSDIVPVVEGGGYAAHVPHDLAWAFEAAAPPVGHARFFELSDLGELPDLVAKIAQSPPNELV